MNRKLTGRVPSGQHQGETESTLSYCVSVILFTAAAASSSLFYPIGALLSEVIVLCQFYVLDIIAPYCLVLQVHKTLSLQYLKDTGERERK